MLLQQLEYQVITDIAILGHLVVHHIKETVGSLVEDQGLEVIGGDQRVEVIGGGQGLEVTGGDDIKIIKTSSDYRSSNN